MWSRAFNGTVEEIKQGTTRSEVNDIPGAALAGLNATLDAMSAGSTTQKFSVSTSGTQSNDNSISHSLSITPIVERSEEPARSTARTPRSRE